MPSRRLLILSPDHEPRWILLYVHPLSDKWTALVAADDPPPPEPGSPTGQVFFGEILEEADQAAKAYPGCSEPVNCATERELIEDRP